MRLLKNSTGGRELLSMLCISRPHLENNRYRYLPLLSEIFREIVLCSEKISFVEFRFKITELKKEFSKQNTPVVTFFTNSRRRKRVSVL